MSRDTRRPGGREQAARLSASLASSARLVADLLHVLIRPDVERAAPRPRAAVEVGRGAGHEALAEGRAARLEVEVVVPAVHEQRIGLEARGDRVSVLRGGRMVLTEVSLVVVACETLSVLGSSGSGKTTLLRAIPGFVTPQLGVVRIGDELASEGGRLFLAPEERDVVMVFQDLALWPHLTVHGNLAFGLDGKRVARGERDDRIAAMLRRVGLSGKERRHPGELSGGERQRVAIARALVLEPRAVLFDEPLSNLDIGLKQELLALFRELLGERHATALYVTHDPREAQALADRTAVLDQGRIVHLGRLDALRSRSDLPLAGVILEALG